MMPDLMQMSRAWIAAWQPIETAPKDGTLILAWWEDTGVGSEHYRPCILAWRRRGDDGRWDDDSGDTYQDYSPTHWMPIPEPPEST